MKAGIFAAGMGSRFVKAGWDQPKPLIPVKGMPLVGRLLENFFQAGVEKVEILLNAEPRFDPVETYLRNHPEASRIGLCRKTTASSYESFSLVAARLGPPPFLLSTVDTLFSAEELKRFLDLRQYPPDCTLVLAVTRNRGDRKPLWVELSPEGRILGLGPSASDRTFVTAGLYLVLAPLPLPVLFPVPALRDYLASVAKGPWKVWGAKFEQALDIDSPDDVRAAEGLL